MILEGVTDQGAVVPVQVTAQGKLVAEGLADPWVDTGSGIKYSDGNVGIGSDPGTMPLLVSGGTNTDVDVVLALSAVDLNPMQLQFLHNANNFWVLQSVQQQVAYRPLVLNPYGGFVGVGTFAPLAELHVEGSLLVTSAIKMRSPNGTTFSLSVDDAGNLSAAPVAMRRSAIDARDYASRPVSP